MQVRTRQRNRTANVQTIGRRDSLALHLYDQVEDEDTGQTPNGSVAFVLFCWAFLFRSIEIASE